MDFDDAQQAAQEASQETQAPQAEPPGPAATLAASGEGPITLGPANEVNVPALFVALGGLLALVGSFLPWITATVPFAGSVSRSGIEGGDGWISVILGAGLLIVGGALATGRSASGIAKSWITLALIGVLVFGFGLVEFNSVQERLKSVDSDFRSLASIGVGIWMIIVGGALSAVAGFSLRSTFKR